MVNNLYFITGNKGKFNEAKSIIPNIEIIDIDLPEIQEMNAEMIIKDKLFRAKEKYPKKELICEDTSVYINSLGGLPGPLIKWFLESLGDRGISDLVKNSKDNTAIAKTIIGYSGKSGKIKFFEGEINGTIVDPRGLNGFGWDKIFQPYGENKTFGEMNFEEKNEFSMRKKALIKLKEYIDNEN